MKRDACYGAGAVAGDGTVLLVARVLENAAHRGNPQHIY